jgi:endonuclease/exonuclease/phosphatase family metal-dependent hydrolase
MELRVASYNVHRGVGGDGRRDVNRTLAVSREIDADILGLQEVDHNLIGSNGPDLLGLASECGYRVVHGMTLRRDDADYGNALLARAALLKTRRHDISVAGVEPRGVLDVNLEVAETALRVLVTHFGLKAAERHRQARRVAALLQSGHQITLLLGDLSEWSPVARSLRPLQRFFSSHPAPRSFPTRWPLVALDRVWVYPRDRLLHVAAHRTALARVASDHLPLMSRIEV